MEALESRQAETCVIAVEKFEGPLDLLWNLIKNSKLDITEIPLALVTEQYISYLKLMETLNIQVAAEFIVMASELIYYKSRALLPAEEMADEYFVPPLPPNLVQKLLEYKKYQAASEELKQMYERQSDCFVRNNIPGEITGDEIYLEVSLFDLLRAFAGVIDSKETIEQEEIVFDEVLVSDRISAIMDILMTRESVLFEELVTAASGRAMIIASFLAILEMSRMRRIRIMQHRIFGEIRVFRSIDPAAGETPVLESPLSFE